MPLISSKDMIVNLSLNVTTQNYNDPRIQIIEADNAIQMDMLKFPKQFQYGICGVLWLLILIGSKFRYVLYKYIFDQYRSKELTSINILTLVVALVDHVRIVLLVLYGTLMIISDSSLQYVTGGLWICSILMYIIEFGRYYSFIGGLIIAIYRILLIKNYLCASSAAAKRNISRVLLFAGISLSLLSVATNAINDYEQTRRDTCMLVFRNHILILLDEYEQSLGNSSISSYWAAARLAINVSMLCMVVAEIIIYIIFFHDMYKNDNSQGLRRLLDPSVIRSRNRRNAITFFGQFCSFLFEFSWTLLYVFTVVIGIRSKGLVFARFFLKMVSFPIISIVDVLTSNILRSKLFKFNLYDFIFGLK
jgi:hypothetical protein